MQPFTGQLVRPRRFYRQWMLAGNRALFFEHLSKTFGDFVHYRGLFNFYLVNHPALVKQVLQQTHDAFDKRSVIYNRFRNAFGDGLVTAEGDRWQRQRRLLQKIFGPITIKRFFPMMVASATAMCDRWERWCRDQTVFNIAGEMNRITLEIAGKALFHNGFDQAIDHISRWTHTINYYSGKPPLPIVRSFWFPSRLNYRLKQTLREFHTFLQTMIDNRRGGTAQDDLLAILLEARHEDSGESMTDHEIKEEALGMIIGGHETSSSALTWLWYELDKNPQAQQRLLEEICGIGDSSFDVEAISRLDYCRMVIEETLRLHPPFWFENRNVIRELELGGERLPPGSLVAFSRYSLHRHPDFWKDPNRFDPDRHRPDAEENPRSTYACVPFGGGPRICIGVHFAMLELVVILAIVLRRYRIVVDESNQHEMSANLTMEPKHGLQVRLERR